MEFTPFTDRDFDAYLQQKWTSNVFNRERLEVKQKLIALGRLLSPGLRAADGSFLLAEVSAEHPAIGNQRRVANQHLFFSRNEETRRELDRIIDRQRSIAALIEDPSPLRNHIFLSVMIDCTQLEIALKLHSDAAVDRENFQRKCQEYFHRERLVRAINELPSGFSVGVAGRDAVEAERVDDALLQKMIQDFPGTASWFEVRYIVRRSDPLATSMEFAEFAREKLSHNLLPLLNYIAWNRDNDFVSMRETLKKNVVEQKSCGLLRNDQVRVVKGMLAGKSGVIQEIDAKGGIKVLIGTMVVKLSGTDVVKL